MSRYSPNFVIADESVTSRKLSKDSAKAFDVSISPFAFNCDSIIDPNYVIGSLNASGVEAASLQRIRSDYFQSSKDFTINILNTVFNCYLYTFDQNKVFVSQLLITSDIKIIVNSAYFYRLLIFKNQLEDVVNISDYIEAVVIGSGVNHITSTVISSENRINDVGLPLYLDFEIGAYNVAGDKATHAQKIRTVDYFQLSEDFFIKLQPGYYCGIFVYDNYKTFISFSTYTSDTKITVNPSFYYNATIFKEVLEDVVDVEVYRKAVQFVLGEMWMSYENKKIMTLGDSITAIPTDIRGWQKYFNAIMQPLSFINTAVSGATWNDYAGTTAYDGTTFTGDLNVIGNQVQKIVNTTYDAPDIIIIAAGTNDSDSAFADSEIEAQFFAAGVPVALENADRKTWAGSMRWSIETLRVTYPNAQIFITTPLQRFSDTVDSFNIVRDKGDIIKRICARLSIPVIDTLECGVYGQYAVNGVATLDYNDGLHLSAIGAEKMGKYIARKIIDWFSF